MLIMVCKAQDGNVHGFIECFLQEQVVLTLELILWVDENCPQPIL